MSPLIAIYIDVNKTKAINFKSGSDESFRNRRKRAVKLGSDLLGEDQMKVFTSPSLDQNHVSIAM